MGCVEEMHDLNVCMWVGWVLRPGISPASQAVWVQCCQGWHKCHSLAHSHKAQGWSVPEAVWLSPWHVALFFCPSRSAHWHGGAPESGVLHFVDDPPFSLKACGPHSVLRCLCRFRHGTPLSSFLPPFLCCVSLSFLHSQRKLFYIVKKKS